MLCTDVKDLDHALRVGGNLREVYAVKDCALQRSRLDERLFGTLASGIIGADQEVSDDHTFGVAQCRDRHDRGKAAAVLTYVSQLVYILNTSGGLEDQRLKSRCDRSTEFVAQRLGTRNQLLRI